MKRIYQIYSTCIQLGCHSLSFPQTLGDNKPLGPPPGTNLGDNGLKTVILGLGESKRFWAPCPNVCACGLGDNIALNVVEERKGEGGTRLSGLGFVKDFLTGVGIGALIATGGGTGSVLVLGALAGEAAVGCVSVVVIAGVTRDCESLEEMVAVDIVRN